jgi:hypothetical protein
MFRTSTAPSNIGPGTANKSEDREKKSQLEGPAAYAPYDETPGMRESVPVLRLSSQ